MGNLERQEIDFITPKYCNKSTVQHSKHSSSYDIILALKLDIFFDAAKLFDVVDLEEVQYNTKNNAQ